jgi:hypothetical protein
MGRNATGGSGAEALIIQEVKHIESEIPLKPERSLLTEVDGL